MVRGAKKGLVIATLALGLAAVHPGAAATGNYAGQSKGATLFGDVLGGSAGSQATADADNATGAMSVVNKVVETTQAGVFVTELSMGVGGVRAAGYGRILHDVTLEADKDYRLVVKVDVTSVTRTLNAALPSIGATDLYLLASWTVAPNAPGRIDLALPGSYSWTGDFQTGPAGAGTLSLDIGLFGDAVMNGAGSAEASASGRVSEITLLTCTTAPDPVTGDPVRTCA